MARLPPLLIPRLRTYLKTDKSRLKSGMVSPVLIRDLLLCTLLMRRRTVEDADRELMENYITYVTDIFEEEALTWNETKTISSAATLLSSRTRAERRPSTNSTPASAPSGFKLPKRLSKRDSGPQGSNSGSPAVSSPTPNSERSAGEHSASSWTAPSRSSSTPDEGDFQDQPDYRNAMKALGEKDDTAIGDGLDLEGPPWTVSG